MSNLKKQLQALVDTYGLSIVITRLAEVCGENAAALLEINKDSRSGHTWQADANILDAIRIHN